MHSPTDEQTAILDFTRASTDNLMIRAYAGTGKTYMLESIDRDTSPTKPNLLVCFNREIADQASKRVRAITPVKTFNSLGHGIFSDAIGKKLKLSKTKILDIYRDITDKAPRYERSGLWRHWDLVKSGVDFARAIGYIPASHYKAGKSIATIVEVEDLLDETVDPEVLALIDKVLFISIKQSYQGIIDFNDQCYMSALFAGQFPRFPRVLVDEYQDLNPIQQVMVNKLTKHSQLIGVGDEAQAIYAFRGANAESMPGAVRRFDMAVLPLSISFRCPSKIVANVRWRVPNFNSSQEGGDIETLHGGDIGETSAVICRNNAPLMALATKLTVSGRSVDIGGVEIANRILKLLTKLGPETFTQAQTLDAIARWEAERSTLDSKSAKDTAECMRVFALRGKTLSAALAYAKHITEAKGTVRFMTGHKAKGLEFDHVYHLDSHLLHRGKDQDSNIEYVVDTRTRDRLSYIDSETI